MKDTAFSIMTENTLDQYIYTATGVVQGRDDNPLPGPVILSDTILDIKSISVPMVSRTLLTNIVINTIKKHAAYIPTRDHVDYRIVKKEKGFYSLAVFLLTRPPATGLQKKKVFCNCSITDALVRLNRSYRDATFIIAEDSTLFCYRYTGGSFTERTIFFVNKLPGLDPETTYQLLLTPGSICIKNVKAVSCSEVSKALHSLQGVLFRPMKKISLLPVIASGLAAVLLMLAVSLQVSINHKAGDARELTSSTRRLSDAINEIRSGTTMTDETYRTLIRIIESRSSVYLFLTRLHEAGYGNIQLKTVSCSDNSFSITGYCSDDSELEHSFRSIEYWDTVHFSFSRKNNTTHFRISGSFNAI
jgi:hypothetical protein